MITGEKIGSFIEHYCLKPESAQVAQLMEMIKKFILDVHYKTYGTSGIYRSLALVYFKPPTPNVSKQFYQSVSLRMWFCSFRVLVD